MSVSPSQLSEYLAYADQRCISIMVRDYFGSDEPPLEMHFAFVPSESSCAKDEVVTSFLEDLYGRDGYSIDQRLSIRECGASSCAEEVAVEVVGSVASHFVVRALGKIRGWISSAATRVNERNGLSDEECMDAISRNLQRFYRPSGTLTFLSHDGTSEDFTAKIRDSKGVVWTCNIDRRTGITSAKRE